MLVELILLWRRGVAAAGGAALRGYDEGCALHCVAPVFVTSVPNCRLGLPEAGPDLDLLMDGARASD